MSTAYKRCSSYNAELAHYCSAVIIGLDMMWAARFVEPARALQQISQSFQAEEKMCKVLNQIKTSDTIIYRFGSQLKMQLASSRG
jgi:hypothetical protein